MKYKPPTGLSPAYQCNECAIPVHAPAVFRGLFLCRPCLVRANEAERLEEACRRFDEEPDETIESILLDDDDSDFN